MHINTYTYLSYINDSAVSVAAQVPQLAGWLLIASLATPDLGDQTETANHPEIKRFALATCMILVVLNVLISLWFLGMNRRLQTFKSKFPCISRSCPPCQWEQALNQSTSVQRTCSSRGMFAARVKLRLWARVVFKLLLVFLHVHHVHHVQCSHSRFVFWRSRVCQFELLLHHLN